jgi:Transposase IS4
VVITVVDGEAPQTVLILAWKDAQVVNFASTVVNPHIKVAVERKRPSRATTDKHLRAVYGNAGRKVLSIPEYIDHYNHRMGAVDIADQLRSYYRGRKRHYRTWRPYWCFLLHTTISNLSLIWMRQPRTPSIKQSGHLTFMRSVLTSLMRENRAQSHTLPVGGQGRRTDLSKPAATTTATPPLINCTNQRLEKALTNQGDPLKYGKDCKVCQSDGKVSKTGQKRKALGELSINSVEWAQDEGISHKRRRLHVPRTTFACSGCKMSLCKEGDCFKRHVELSRAANTLN